MDIYRHRRRAGRGFDDCWEQTAYRPRGPPRPRHLVRVGPSVTSSKPVSPAYSTTISPGAAGYRRPARSQPWPRP